MMLRSYPSFCRLPFVLGLIFAAGAATAATLPPWEPGVLEIHQISTGRGNSALIIGPDGTSFIIDVGVATGDARQLSTPRPSAARRPGEWVARYAQRQLARTGQTGIDYLLVTHLHADHVGVVDASTPKSPHGDYFLSGVTDVADVLPIGKLIDRGFPDYKYPSQAATVAFARNYLNYVSARRQAGKGCERIIPGHADQLTLQHTPATFPTFAIRTIAANAEVWTGHGDEAKSVIPANDALQPGGHADENTCSIALRLTYGEFDYYTGGDLPGSTMDPKQPWRDIGTAVARVTGPVEVAVTDHHGYFDAVSTEAVMALRPQAWIVPAWHITHPGMPPMERMTNEKLYPGHRDIFITSLTPIAEMMNERFMSKVTSKNGHIVVRVEKGGGTFRIFVTDDGDETDTVKSAYGPYTSEPRG